MKELYIRSSHASAEFDLARQLTLQGYKVSGNWDVGSKQRPKVSGVTDHNEEMKQGQVIIQHQIDNYGLEMERLLKQGHSVLQISFGQGCIQNPNEHPLIARLCNQYEKAYVIPYSLKDWNTYKQLGVPDKKNRLIRFGKYTTDYGDWKGTIPAVYISCNDIHNRGNGCYYAILQHIRAYIPFIISGKNTQAINGLGEICETSMRSCYQNCRAYLSLGTAPAPYVMTMMEATMAGCPLVLYDNGHGIANEGLKSYCDKNVNNIIQELKRLIAEPNQEAHEKALEDRKLFRC